MKRRALAFPALAVALGLATVFVADTLALSDAAEYGLLLAVVAVTTIIAVPLWERSTRA